MQEIQDILNEDGTGSFRISEGREELGNLHFKISDKVLTALHTKVYPEGEGKGFGKKLFLHMVEYARQNKLQVEAICPFVQAQFKRHPDDYTDIIYLGFPGQ